jgi:hypothetical protein
LASGRPTAHLSEFQSFEAGEAQKWARPLAMFSSEMIIVVYFLSTTQFRRMSRASLTHSVKSKE